MTKPKLTVLAAAILLAAAGRAQAQIVEIGAGVGSARILGGSDWWGRGVEGPQADLKAGVVLSDRFAIDTFVTYGRRSIPISQYGPLTTGADTQIAEGLYGVVIEQRVLGSRVSGFHAFVSYGLGGWYSRMSVPAHQYQSGRTVVTIPAYTDNDAGGLWFPIGGFGVQKSIGRGLAIRAEGQATTFFGFPIGGRGSVGVVVPIGHLTASPSRR